MTDQEKQEIERYMGALNETHVESLKAINDGFVILNNKLDNHTKILDEHTKILGEHGKILDEHSRILNSHTEMIGELKEDVSIIKTDVKDLKENKVSKEEFSVFTKKSVV